MYYTKPKNQSIKSMVVEMCKKYGKDFIENIYNAYYRKLYVGYANKSAFAYRIYEEMPFKSY